MASISKRASGAWQNTSYGTRGTATDTITTLPTTIYSDGTNTTVSIKGNTTQSGTPTSDSPVMLQGCGELETVGAKAGQYKIPISSASTTTPVYLGEVETTRKIKKVVFDGTESWLKTSSRYYYTMLSSYPVNWLAAITSHFEIREDISSTGCARFGGTASAPQNTFVINYDNGAGGIDSWKSYLAAQYAAGTPVTVWYVLAEPTTGIVNEPLMKIEDYADEVNNISIPTTDGANTLSVDTTVQPSEVSVNYHGWHMGAVHERTAGQWD